MGCDRSFKAQWDLENHLIAKVDEDRHPTKADLVRWQLQVEEPIRHIPPATSTATAASTSVSVSMPATEETWTEFLKRSKLAGQARGSSLGCPACNKKFSCGEDDPFPLWTHLSADSVVGVAGHPTKSDMDRWGAEWKSSEDLGASSSRKKRKKNPTEEIQSTNATASSANEKARTTRLINDGGAGTDTTQACSSSSKNQRNSSSKHSRDSSSSQETWDEFLQKSKAAGRAKNVPLACPVCSWQAKASCSADNPFPLWQHLTTGKPSPGHPTEDDIARWNAEWGKPTSSRVLT